MDLKSYDFFDWITVIGNADEKLAQRFRMIYRLISRFDFVVTWLK